ncbi:hypothetical protein [Caulobacter hibisci]|uniref:Uncharacterized protein n=1 Tax=Caulobacter hibisci TaxID=2035993 RepID=A0ABS0T0H4_9CAUL|nr:hypothetical protein [Caulobacter hibisci]MBI1685391.1 hypothetical protein [Caulobacter hibisci]
MSTKTHLKIAAAHLCETLDTRSWYDLTTGPKVQLASPLQLADGVDELKFAVPLAGHDLLDWVERHLSGRLHGKDGRLHFKVAEPADHIISADYFVEALLGSAGRIDKALRSLTKIVTGAAWTLQVEEELLEIIDGVRDGKVDAAAFAARMAQSDFAPGTPGYHHVFARNAHILIEQTRTALLRAFDHADRMMAQVRILLANEQGFYPPLKPGQEIVNSSMTSERIHGAFADGVGAVATALDLLYRVFVYLVREPFGAADLPGKLYFPYNEVGKPYRPFPTDSAAEPTDVGAADLPYALPNVAAGNFFALRAMRNDLTHNMMSGHIQPSCFVGRGTSLVAGISIRYVQAVAPDIDGDGKPLKHAYVERFYLQQRDAAVQLHDLVEELALTVDHSFQWLAHRLEQRIARAAPGGADDR